MAQKGMRRPGKLAPLNKRTRDPSALIPSSQNVGVAEQSVADAAVDGLRSGRRITNLAEWFRRHELAGQLSLLLHFAAAPRSKQPVS